MHEYINAKLLGLYSYQRRLLPGTKKAISQSYYLNLRIKGRSGEHQGKSNPGRSPRAEGPDAGDSGDARLLQRNPSKQVVLMP